MKELRFKAADGVWRVAFAFKKRFYRELIRKADDRFDKHLTATKKGKG